MAHLSFIEKKTRPRRTIELMNAEQSERIAIHIPHRVRAGIALPPTGHSLLGVKASIDPGLPTDRDWVYWRCATDSISVGRLAATRWLIEFVGIKRNSDGKINYN
jgi:hypothetical protein